MFDDIGHQRALRKLQKQQEATRKAYGKEIRQAQKAGKTSDDIESIRQTGFFEDRFYDDQIEFLQSTFLIGKAQRYVLSAPNMDLQSDITGLWRLSLPAQETLALKLNKHEARRRKVVQTWMTALAGLIGAGTGFLGVVVALVAVWC